jgi:nucleoside-diphosphate-sugar epimerase
MRFAITGEKGFIARNLSRVMAQKGHEFVSLLDCPQLANKRDTGEPCVYRNGEHEWYQALYENKIDVLIHNAAVVGTDVVALRPDDATLTNVLGCQIIARVCRKLHIPVCYMGTTVIYDTPMYQQTVITEDSHVRPHTYYGILKLAGEQAIKELADEWMVIRPLFAYGGDGDMNSLIVKSLYAAHHDRRDVDMFLSPRLVKDYLHVDDYCVAVVKCCEKGLWRRDFNVAAETPYTAQQIVEIMSHVTGDDIASRLNWHPDTDYLGNHRLSSVKVRSSADWEPYVGLKLGVEMIWKDMRGLTHNPLLYLDEAKKKGVDLLSHF